MDRVYRMNLPENIDDNSYDVATHRTTFIRFLKANLPNQTNIRIDPHCASQSQTIRTMAQHVYRDVIIRQDEVDIYLPTLAMQTGHQGEDDPQAAVEDTPFSLSDIYKEEVEALNRDAYPMNCARFGFDHYQ